MVLHVVKLGVLDAAELAYELLIGPLRGPIVFDPLVIP